MITPNLWGELPEIEDIRAPITILKEQAAQLQVMTKNLLRGKVIRRFAGTWFNLELRMLAPAIDNYEYTVLEVRHPIDNYPLTVTAGYESGRPDSGRMCSTEGEFVAALADILGSEKVRTIIKSLLIQSRALG